MVLEKGAQTQIEGSGGVYDVACKVKQINHYPSHVILNCLRYDVTILLRCDKELAIGIEVGMAVKASCKRLPASVEMYQVLEWLTKVQAITDYAASV